jgi:2,4-dienoyl-CoA reductase-like NADH-dependent reductase (Old Yellow Enzyme family)
MLLPFLSRTTNKRNDRYWGSLENCARIVFETAIEIRCRVPPSFIVSIKLNSAEFRRARFDPKECKRLCKQLEAFRLDFFELPGDTYEELAFKHKLLRTSRVSVVIRKLVHHSWYGPAGERPIRVETSWKGSAGQEPAIRTRQTLD